MEAQTNLDKIFNLSSQIDSLIPFIRNKYLIVCRGKTVHSRDNKFWHPKIRSKKHHVVVCLQTMQCNMRHLLRKPIHLSCYLRIKLRIISHTPSRLNHPLHMSWPPMNLMGHLMENLF